MYNKIVLQVIARSAIYFKIYSSIDIVLQDSTIHTHVARPFFRVISDEVVMIRLLLVCRCIGHTGITAYKVYLIGMSMNHRILRFLRFFCIMYFSDIFFADEVVYQSLIGKKENPVVAQAGFIPCFGSPLSFVFCKGHLLHLVFVRCSSGGWSGRRRCPAGDHTESGQSGQ
ncbi:hypothetical protein D3C72_1059310 [compost metagenome]